MMDTVTATRTFHDVFTFLIIRVLPLYILTRILFDHFGITFGMQTTTEDMSVAKRIREAKDFAELCWIFGYVHEEHVVTTEDGYMLTLHRILPKSVEGSAKDATRPTIYLQHGLLTSSELFVCVTDANRCLPFVLTEHGYDVWLGNNRGNKYSQNHIGKKAKSSNFWDFSIDDFARYDIPNSIDFILDHTKAEKLSYIGFSQGTAQAFAALSLHPELNDKIGVFVALAPIMRPPGYATPILDYLIKHFPSTLFHVFGRKSMLSSVVYWQSVLPTAILGKVIDISLIFLFNYHSRNITKVQKVAGYAHIYCYSSVKAVVHWSQIMRNSAFHMYEEDRRASSPVAHASLERFQRFPTDQIKTSMVLIYGDQDTLIDISTLMEQLPDNVSVHKLEGYEHLDILWGKDVHLDVIPTVLEALKP